MKASEDVDAITVDGVTVSSYTTRTERTGWGLVVPQGHLPRIYLHRHRSCPDHGLRSLRSECGRYCQ